MPQPRLSPRAARHCTWSAFLPRVGLHQRPSEKSRPRGPACGQPILSHVSTHAQSAAKAQDFARASPLSTGETDSPLEGTGFELLVRGRGEGGCRACDAPSCLGRVAAAGATLPPRSALREQIPIAVSELADQYLMRLTRETS